MAEVEKKGSGFKWLVGCTLGVVAVGILCAGLGFFGFRWVKDKLIQGVRDGLAELVEDSGLPQDQVDSLLSDVDRLADAFEAGDIEEDGIERFIRAMDDETLIALGLVQAFDASVLDSVGLPPDEVGAARLTLQRFARGIQEDQISGSRGRRVFSTGRNADESRRAWRERWATAEEVRETVAEAKRLADEAGIADEPFEMDVAAEFGRLVDEVVR